MALSLYAGAYSLRKQSIRQKDDVGHAIVKQLAAPTLEELEGEMPEPDPFAPGADDTKGMEIIEKQNFLAKLEARRRRWVALGASLLCML